MVLVPSNTEIIFCGKASNNITSADQQEINGFGLKIFKKAYRRITTFYLDRLSSKWLLLNPSEQLKTYRDCQIYKTILLKSHDVTLAFGSLVSPYHFKCADPKFFFQTNGNSPWNIFFAKRNSNISINIERVRYTLKREHIDIHRGVIIDVKSPCNFTIHVCLKGNLDEYASQNYRNGMLPVVEK